MALKPQKMRGHDEVHKGLGGLVCGVLWLMMISLGNLGGRMNLLNEYWRGVKVALDLPLPSMESL